MRRHIKTRDGGKIHTRTEVVDRYDPLAGLRDAVKVAVRPILDVLDDVKDVLALYDRWEPHVDVTVGDIVSYDGRLYEAVQPHTTQSDWTPDVVPALFGAIGVQDDEGHTVWEPGVTLTVDEVVSYDSRLWRTIQTHTTQDGWNPDVTPALFEEVDDG